MLQNPVNYGWFKQIVKQTLHKVENFRRKIEKYNSKESNVWDPLNRTKSIWDGIYETLLKIKINANK